MNENCNEGSFSMNIDNDAYIQNQRIITNDNYIQN